MRHLRFLALLILLGVPVLGFGQQTGVNYFRVLGGPPNSTIFLVAAKLANIISHPPGTPDCVRGGSCGVPGLIGIAQNRANTILGLRALKVGQAESIIAPADQYYQDSKNDGGGSELRALASLDRLTVHFIVLKSAMIERLDQLKDKKIAIGRSGTDNEATAKIILNALNITQKNKNLVTQSPQQSFHALRSEQIDALIVVDRVNSNILNSLFSHGDLKLLNLDEKSISKLQRLKAFTKIVQLPADIYPGEKPIAAIEIPVLWLVRNDIPFQLAYQLARVLQSDKETFPHFSKDIAPGILHDGAKKLYDEIAQTPSNNP